MNIPSAEENKSLVLEAFDALFNKRDYAKAAEFWSETYIQHSAHIGPGRDGLFNLVRNLPDTLRYENAVVLAEGDRVMLHGRFSGHGRPRAWIAADIVRIEGGRLVEHWDVLQDEASAVESKSGLPMFGNLFAEPDRHSAPVVAGSPLTIEEARAIVAPLYDALNEPAKKDVAALLANAANPDYQSHHTNEEWLSRDQLGEIFKNMGSVIPDLRWTIEDIQTFGDQIVVRGKATGTPTGEFWGAKPTGRGFNTMAIDIFTVKNGKLATAYHVENWMTALQQIGK
ncbi:ester cyclase [Methylocapsa sp. S129]|uniref:ester cyclase n=1 Tax=Methylocapsa sp. S129 TaxID=1641869 RepID=UPI00131D0478|nr:ester cyclase [Methylocapsa sp. S129]